MTEVEVYISQLKDMRECVEFDSSMIFYQVRNILDKIGEKVYAEEWAHVTEYYLMDELVCWLMQAIYLK